MTQRRSQTLGQCTLTYGNHCLAEHVHFAQNTGVVDCMQVLGDPVMVDMSVGVVCHFSDWVHVSRLAPKLCVFH